MSNLLASRHDLLAALGEASCGALIEHEACLGERARIELFERGGLARRLLDSAMADARRRAAGGGATRRRRRKVAGKGPELILPKDLGDVEGEAREVDRIHRLADAHAL